MAAKRLANPFDYRFGRVPLVWAGRTELLTIIKASTRRRQHEPRRQNLLVGPRGSGKTALIREWYATARERRWRVVYITAESGQLLDAVAKECHEVMPVWERVSGGRGQGVREEFCRRAGGAGQPQRSRGTP